MATKTNQASAAVAEAPDIDWGVVEGKNTEFAVQYPRMQWVHGEKKASGFNKTGGLFISTEQYPNFQAEGFQAETFISRKDEIPGFGSALAHIAVIRVKHQWVKDEARNVPLVHALIVAKGCEDLICLSLRGASKALEFQKAFNQHMAHNVSLANRTRPANAPALEPFALWFPVKAGEIEVITSKDGKNESSVTLPALSHPDTLDIGYVRSLWVGSDNYRLFASYFRETAVWQKLPIWEQRNGDDAETPQFTGDTGEAATDAQLQHLINICTAKGLDEREMMLDFTKGASNQFESLTKAQASEFIERLKVI